MGQKRLESAIQTFQSQDNNNNNNNINVVWKPYMIDPGTKATGEDFQSYNRRRWGSSGWTHHLKSEGRKDGFGATFSDWKWWPNTLKAHCLVQFAQEKYNVDTSKSNSALFHALYEQGKNISLIDTLVQIGVRDLGLPDEGELREYLEGESGDTKVKHEIQEGQSMYRISGVPYFVIGKDSDDTGRPYGFSGAQSQDAFLNVFEELSES